MPIYKRKNGWYWDENGPYKTLIGAEQDAANENRKQLLGHNTKIKQPLKENAPYFVNENAFAA